MAAQEVRPNRRGVRSREAVLDAAERVFAEDGFEAATSARIVEASGIPISSVYHYFGSKQGVLLAVMERGARRFFDASPAATTRHGDALSHLEAVVAATARTLAAQPDFLRIVLVMSASPTSGQDALEAHAVVSRVRAEATRRLAHQVALAFDLRPSDDEAQRLARFALAAIDGAFVAHQAEAVSLEAILADLPRALLSLHVPS